MKNIVLESTIDTAIEAAIHTADVIKQMKAWISEYMTLDAEQKAAIEERDKIIAQQEQEIADLKNMIRAMNNVINPLG